MRFQDTLVNNDDSSIVSHDFCDSDEENLSELDNDNLSLHSHDVFQGSDANVNEELNQDEFQMEDVSNMHQQQQFEQPVDNNNNMIDIIGLEDVTPAVTNTLIHG